MPIPLGLTEIIVIGMRSQRKVKRETGYFQIQINEFNFSRFAAPHRVLQDTDALFCQVLNGGLDIIRL